MSKLQALTKPRYLREDDVLAIFPFARATLHRRVKDRSFPQPVKIAPRVNAWLADEIADYQSKIEAQRSA